MWHEERNGKHRFFESYKNPLTDKRQIVSCTMENNTRATRKRAQEILQAKIDERLGAGRQRDITLRELIAAYIQDQRLSVRRSTQITSEYSLRAVERILDPDAIVSRLTAPYIRERLLATGEDGVTLNGRRKNIKKLLQWAYKNDYVQDITYLAKLERFKEDVAYLSRIEDKYLEQADLDALISGMQVENWKLLTAALAASGMRPGEFYALTNKDVNFKTRTITITKSYSRTSKEVTAPKTHSSNREIYMQQDLYKTMYAIKKAMERQAKNYEYVPRGIFFCATDGGYISHDAYAKYFRENCQRVLGRSYTPYVLRHTHVSLLAAGGQSLDAIARRVGHDNSAITRRIYFHVTKKLQEQENAALDQIKIIR